MKKIIFLMLAAAFSIATYAQDRPVGERRKFTPEETAMARTQRLHEAVQLDSVQFQAIFLMNYSDAVAMQDSLQAGRERREQMKKEGKRPERVQPTEEEMRVRKEIMEKRRALRDEQMKQILTAEQYEKYTEYMKRSNERMRAGGPRRGGAPRR